MLEAVCLVEPEGLRIVAANGAAGRLADQPCIFGQCSRPMPRWRRLPGFPTCGEFIIVDQQVHAARAGIDPDTVAFAHQRQRTADEGFRRHIADAHAAGRAGKASVGDEGNVLAHALAIDQRGDTQHLAHAGAANRALIADDQHVAGGIFAVAHGVDAMFLVLEHARGPFEHQIPEAGHLDHGAIGAKVALQHRHAAIGGLAASGYDVIGDPGELRPRPSPEPGVPGPADQAADRVLDAAVDAAAALVVNQYRKEYPGASPQPQRAGQTGLASRLEAAIASSPRLKRTVRDLSSRYPAVRRLRILTWQAMERTRARRHS